MTVALIALALLGPPDARGGEAATVRGGPALPVIGLVAGEPVTRARDLPTFAAFACIHTHEARWNDTRDPYWGGLQMDRSFMRAYGRDMLARHRGRFADAWTPAEQIVVATRAWLTRGYGPWPNTRKPCHV